MAEPASSPSTSAVDGAKRRLAAADCMAGPAPGADGCGARRGRFHSADLPIQRLLPRPDPYRMNGPTHVLGPVSPEKIVFGVPLTHIPGRTSSTQDEIAPERPRRRLG